MRIAYFDCWSGISGDMTVSALLDAGAELSSIQSAVDSMGLAGVLATASQTTRKGFRGLLFSVTHPPQNVHRNLSTILGLIRRSSISNNAKDIAMRIFERIGRAEAKVHGTSLDRIHFHEIGAIDSIVDIVGTAVAWDELGIEKAYASPIPTGAGTVKIAHGVVSIPAPATAELLSNVPIAPCGLPFEMTTPTGAAIVAELIEEFGPIPSIQVNRIGYGSGQREMPDRPNLLRVLLGHEVPGKRNTSNSPSDDFTAMDQICVLETNLDDITGEQIGFAIEMAWKSGALDVFTIPIQMKKNRPGVLLTVLCRHEDRNQLESVLFQHTGTLGIRYRKQARTIVPRVPIEIITAWGAISGKITRYSSGVTDFSPEYDHCREIALAHGLRIADVIAASQKSYALSLEKKQPYSPGPFTESSAAKFDSGDAAINKAFLQAAVEDHWKEFGEPTVDCPLPSHSNGTAGFHENATASVTPKAEVDNPGSNEDFLYRWDSSPWG
jgi:uncharacterized protein (TIGR00299 family) protein